MAISRRDVLLRGSAIGVGTIAANVSGLVALAPPPPSPAPVIARPGIERSNTPGLARRRPPPKGTPSERSRQLDKFCCHPRQRRRLQPVPARKLVFPALAPCLSPYV